MDIKWEQVIYENEVYDYEVSDDGHIRNMATDRQLKLFKDGKSGYLKVKLYKNKKPKTISIHRLVATMFIPNPHGYTDVNHINEDKTDNRVENLEWLPHGNNVRHGTGIERRAKTQSKKVKCVETGQIFDSIKQAEEKTGISCGHISEICQGKRKSRKGLHFEYVDD